MIDLNNYFVTDYFVTDKNKNMIIKEQSVIDIKYHRFYMLQKKRKFFINFIYITCYAIQN